VLGNLYEIRFEEGATVEKGSVLMYVEVMKMSVAVISPKSGTLIKLLKSTGTIVKPGDSLCMIE